MVIFFYLYFIAVLLDFLLISNIVPFTSAAYTVPISHALNYPIANAV